MDEKFYIVNPKGAVHEVTQQHAEDRINADPRWRMAEKAEVASYLKTPQQTADKPIATPYVPKGTRHKVVKANGVDNE